MTTPSLIRPCLFQAVVTQNIVSQTPHQPGLLTLYPVNAGEVLLCFIDSFTLADSSKYHSSTDGP